MGTQMAVNTGYRCQPYPGQALCGDAGMSWTLPGRQVLALADGLGHGPGANHAALIALRCIEQNLQQDCLTIFMRCNEQLIHTRGCVLSIALVDLTSNLMTLGSVGNIRNVLMTRERDFKFGANRGFVGAGSPVLSPIQMLLEPGDCLLMFSDGISEAAKISPQQLAGEFSPQQLADDVLTHWHSNEDDASVLIYRHGMIEGVR